VSIFHPLKETFYQDDGSLDEAVLCIVAGTLAMIVFEAVDIRTADFNPVSFGGGMAAMWSGAGALMALRKPAKPKDPQ
jgi:hypothetical protein